MINSREQVMHTIHTWNGGQKGITGKKADDGDDYRKDGYEKNANPCNGGRGRGRLLDTHLCHG